jgi:hypothetical protein
VLCVAARDADCTRFHFLVNSFFRFFIDSLFLALLLGASAMRDRAQGLWPASVGREELPKSKLPPARDESQPNSACT